MRATTRNTTHHCALHLSRAIAGLVCLGLLMGGATDVRAQESADGVIDVSKVPQREGKKTRAKVKAEDVSRKGIRPPMRGFRGGAERGFRVFYADTEDQVFKGFSESLKQSKLFDKLAGDLDSSLVMPGVVDIQFVECGMANAFYDPEAGRIIMCYELLEEFRDIYVNAGRSGAALNQATTGSMLFTFFHELGHSLVDQLNLPVTGKEEDAVDQLATLVLSSHGDNGADMALDSAEWFLQQSKRVADVSDLAFWDEHSLDGQRYYSIACLLYGSDRKAFKHLVTEGKLPRRRAMRCEEEHERISGAWDKILEPHLRDEPEESVEADEDMEEEAATAKAEEPADAAPAEVSAGNVAPEPAPKKMEAQSAKTAAAAGVSCEEAAPLIMKNLFPYMLEEELQGKKGEERAQAKVELEKVLPDFVAQLETVCKEENWSATQRECASKAKTPAQADTCFE